MNSLLNNDNTCYLNSILQIFAHNELIINVILKSFNTSNDSFLLEFVKLIRNLKNNNNVCIDAQKFKKSFFEHYNLSNKGEHEDAHDILIKLINTLHKYYKYDVKLKINLSSYIVKYNNLRNSYKNEPKNEKLKIKYLNLKKKCYNELLNIKGLKHWKTFFENNYSPFVELFFGQYLVHKKCSLCLYSSYHFEIFNSIGLNINGFQNIYQCIENIVTEEYVGNWHCKNCEKKTTLIKLTNFWKLPKILIFYFKRFNNNNNKINKLIYYNMDINLNNFINNFSPFNNKNTYSLNSIINHYGTTKNGHYNTNVKCDNKWINYDDKHINYINDIVNDNAYILFYTISIKSPLSS